ncbi:uncharacterized protein LOC108744587 [Agrilus planipennis]|uniref:Uncharacterized protein LOC108744587 n=1 Tax=Agrilus planipennis TaxID=224129 RepID=A0A1W4XIZ3_AGRPL|nr:uncharacterized protein LOC108744587 [Agrilus planipennis]
MNLIVGSVFFIIILLFLQLPNFLGGSYVWNHEFLNFTYLDRDIYPYAKIINFKLNKTLKTFNLTCKFNCDLTNDMSSYIHLEGYQFRSNEYRMGPINFNVKTCKLLGERSYGTTFLIKNSNITSCPVKKGYYHYYNFAFDSASVPRFVPSGRWKFVIQLFINEKMAAQCDWFVKIEN